MTPKITLTPQDIEYLVDVTHPNKGENDYCIGMTGDNADMLVYSAETTKDGYCLMPDNTKAKKLGFASPDDIHTFVMRKYRNLARDLAKKYVDEFFSPTDANRDDGGIKDADSDKTKGKLSLKMRSVTDDNNGSSESGGEGKVEGNGGATENGSEKGSAKFLHFMGGRGNRFLNDPSFYTDSLSYLRTGKVPYENETMERQRYIVYPDGQIRFWKKSVAKEIGDTAWSTLAGLPPFLVLGGMFFGSIQVGLPPLGYDERFCNAVNADLARRGKGPNLLCQWAKMCVDFLLRKNGEFFSKIYNPVPEMLDQEKEGVLKSTLSSEERPKQYDAFREITKRETLINADDDLQAIWDNSKHAPWKKKNALFEWWDDCIEPGDPAGERDVAGAMYIRERTMEFIREKLPEASNLAYTAEELKKLNTRPDRLSKMEFNPYIQSGRKSDDWLEAFLN